MATLIYLDTPRGNGATEKTSGNSVFSTPPRNQRGLKKKGISLMHRRGTPLGCSPLATITNTPPRSSKSGGKQLNKKTPKKATMVVQAVRPRMAEENGKNRDFAGEKAEASSQTPMPVDSAKLCGNRKSSVRRTHDLLGFPIPENGDIVDGVAVSTEGLAAWEAYEQRELADCAVGQWLRTDKLRSLILSHGVPHKLRPILWFKWSGAEDKQASELCSANAKSYKQLLQCTPPDSVVNQIKVDLPRTCPKHPCFAEECSPGRQALKRVLQAYAVRNPTLGYLQSMNFLCAILYLSLDKDEEKIFWMLAAIVEDILPGYYSNRLKSLLSNVDAFAAIVGEKFPKIAERLDAHNLSISFRAPTWFLCMFFTSLRSEVLVRAWDMIFFECTSCVAAGSASLCCLGLGVLHHVRAKMLSASNISECAKTLQTSSDSILHAGDFVRVSFKEKFSVRRVANELQSKKIKDAVALSRSRISAPATARKRKRSSSMGAASSSHTNIQQVGSQVVEQKPTSLFARFKRWVTPKKKHIRQRIAVTSKPRSRKRSHAAVASAGIKPAHLAHSSRKRRRGFRVDIRQQAVKPSASSPARGLELRMQTTPHQIRSRASSATRYTPPEIAIAEIEADKQKGELTDLPSVSIDLADVQCIL